MKNVKQLICGVMMLLVSFMAASCCTGCEDDVYDVEINYVLTCSEGLLQFVTPVVTYTDENGNVQTITLSDADWIKSDPVQVGDDSQSVTAIGQNAFYWKKSLRFNRINIKSDMEVKYIAKNNVDISNTDLYRFLHSLNWAYNLKKTEDGRIAKAVQNANLELTTGKLVFGNSIQTYLEELSKNPDKITITVDDQGNVSAN